MHVLRKALNGSTIYEGGGERYPFCMHAECCIAADEWDGWRGQPVVSAALMMGIWLYKEGSWGRGARDCVGQLHI